MQDLVILVIQSGVANVGTPYPSIELAAEQALDVSDSYVDQKPLRITHGKSTVWHWTQGTDVLVELSRNKPMVETPGALKKRYEKEIQKFAQEKMNQFTQQTGLCVGGLDVHIVVNLRVCGEPTRSRINSVRLEIL